MSAASTTEAAPCQKTDEFKVRANSVQAGQKLTEEELQEWKDVDNNFFEAQRPGAPKPCYEGAEAPQHSHLGVGATAMPRHPRVGSEPLRPLPLLPHSLGLRLPPSRSTVVAPLW